jgi:hypothetical protein
MRLRKPFIEQTEELHRRWPLPDADTKSHLAAMAAACQPCTLAAGLAHLLELPTRRPNHRSRFVYSVSPSWSSWRRTR